MANTNNGITRVEALEAALNGDLNEQVVAKLKAMIAQYQKPTKKTETKEDKERAELVTAAVTAIKNAGHPVSVTWLMENVKDILTTQKAGAIMRIAIKNGDVTKTYDDKGKPIYSA